MFQDQPEAIDPRDVAMLLDPEHLIKTGYIPRPLTIPLRRAYRWWKKYGLVNAKMAYFQVLELSSSVNGWKTDRIADVLAHAARSDEATGSFTRSREDAKFAPNGERDRE